MFSHDERDVSDSEDEDDSDDENGKDEVIKDDNLFKVEDLEPSLRKVEEAMNKVQQLLMPETTSKLKCDKCDFEAKNKNGLNMHKKAKHFDNEHHVM